MSELTEQVFQTLQEAAPARVEESQANEKMKAEMLRVMTEMEQARERIGDFCVTIGGDRGKAIMLVEPVKGTHANRYAPENPVPVRNYVFATESGFKSLVFSDTEDVGDRERELQEAIRTADNGVVPQAWRQGYSEVQNNPRLPCLWVTEHVVFSWIDYLTPDTKVDDQLVGTAFKASIGRAQKPHQEGTTTAQTNISAATAVSQGLSNQP